MSNFPRRSPRFQQQAQSTQATAGSIPSFASSFSSASSASSTSHPSPTSDSLNILNQHQQYPLQLQSQFLAPTQAFDAPLPSPSATDLDPFGRSQQPLSHYNMGGQTQNQQVTSSYQGENTQSQAYGSQQSHSQQHHHNSFTQPQRPNYPPTSVNGVPPGLPPDFLAEAAKRAQMACLMRDLGDVSL